jgi:hypothetical protein
MSYCDPTDLANEGVDISDSARIQTSITKACEYIDLMTGQWFELRAKDFTLDGGQKIYFLPVFCNSISSINVDGAILSEDDYTLYNRFSPDDRENPKIKFISKVIAGDLNLIISGDFGYVTSLGETPGPINHICTKLAIGYIGHMGEEDPEYRDIIDRGRVVKEVTDRHSYDLGKLIEAGGLITGDPEIDNTIAMYRKPIDIGAI